MATILGMAGSPRKGATERIVKAALGQVEGRPGIKTEFLSLAGKKVAPCNGCGYCRKHNTWCILEDDFQGLFEQFMEADAYLLASPVYVHGVSPQMIAFFTRMRPLHHVFPDKLRYKLGAAVAVGGTRNGGQEFCANALNQMMLTRGISIVSGDIGSYIGGKVWSHDIREFDAADDAVGMETVGKVMNKLAEFAVIFEKGRKEEAET